MTFGLGRLGASFGKLGAGNSVDGPAFSLTAPGLAFVSATNPSADNTQDLLIDIADPGVQVGDELVVRGKIGSDFSTSSPAEYDLTATYAAVLADLTDLTGEITMALTPDGVAYLRAFHKRGSTYSGPSPTISKAIDTTAPTITSADSGNCAENAQLAHVLTANEAVTWSIVGGADQARYEISVFTLRWAGNGTKNYEIPDDADTNNTYVVQVRATDIIGHTTDQTITYTVTDVTEGDVTAPILSSPTAARTGDTTASLGVTTDEGAGTLYWVMTTSATPPSKAQVKAGQNNGGTAAAASGNQAVSGTGAQSISGGATGLTGNTTYYAYLMQEDAVSNQSNVAAASSITTALATSYVTGDRQATITVTASASLLGGGTASNFVDGVFGASSSDAAFFTSGANSSSNKLTFDFGSGNSKRINEAKWYQSSTVTHGTWQWYGSNDGVTSDVAIGNSFTLGGVADGGGGTTPNILTELNGNLNAYRAYILQGVSGSKSGSPWLTEVQFKQSA